MRLHVCLNVTTYCNSFSQTEEVWIIETCLKAKIKASAWKTNRKTCRIVMRFISKSFEVSARNVTQRKLTWIHCQSKEQIETSASAVNFLTPTPRRLHAQEGSSQPKFTWINYHAIKRTYNGLSIEAWIRREVIRQQLLSMDLRKHRVFSIYESKNLWVISQRVNAVAQTHKTKAKISECLGWITETRA